MPLIFLFLGVVTQLQVYPEVFSMVERTEDLSYNFHFLSSPLDAA